MYMLTLAMFGMQEYLIIALVLVLLFGARKLPELARSMGSSLTQFKKGMREDVELPESTGDPESKQDQG